MLLAGLLAGCAGPGPAAGAQHGELRGGPGARGGRAAPGGERAPTGAGAGGRVLQPSGTSPMQDIIATPLYNSTWFAQ